MQTTRCAPEVSIILLHSIKSDRLLRERINGIIYFLFYVHDSRLRYVTEQCLINCIKILLY